jgi:hypothetical protein
VGGRLPRSQAQEHQARPLPRRQRQAAGQGGA